MPLRKPAFLGLLAACAALAADSGLMKLVMPDATAVVGINVDQARSSTFGKFVLSQVPHDDQFNKFVAETGFDPSRNLHEIVIATNTPGSRGTGLVLARGSFDKGKLVALASQMGVKMSNYQGVDLFTAPQSQGHNEKAPSNGAFAFLDGSTMLAGGPALVRAAIDRSLSGASPDPKMLDQVQKISGSNDIWLGSQGPLSNLSGSVPSPAAGAAMRGDVVQAIQSTSAGIRFGTNMLISGEAVTRSEKDANALADVIRFFLSMAQLQTDKPNVPQFLSKIDNVDLHAEGAVLRFSLSIPESVLENLTTPHAKPAAKKKGAELD